jgi:hypothetical protein
MTAHGNHKPPCRFPALVGRGAAPGRRLQCDHEPTGCSLPDGQQSIASEITSDSLWSTLSPWVGASVTTISPRVPWFMASYLPCGLLLLSVALVFSGCVSKAKAKAQAHAAFVAGQQDAIRRMSLTQNPTVTINGEVRNAAVPWIEGLTLAKAIVAAEYYGKSDPTDIIIVRAGVATRVDMRKLLAGEDLPLSPGDIVELRRQLR